MSLTLTLANVERLDNGQSCRLVLDRHGALIGRSPSADWTLPDPNTGISYIHCEIVYHDGGYILYDKSTNGTFVNNARERVKGPYTLVNGDELAIGHYRILVRLSEGAGAEEPAKTPAAPAQPWGWDEARAPQQEDDGWGSAQVGQPPSAGWEPAPAPPPIEPRAAPQWSLETAAAQGDSASAPQWRFEGPAVQSAPAPLPQWNEAPAAAISGRGPLRDNFAPPPAAESSHADDVWNRFAKSNAVDWKEAGFESPAQQVPQEAPAQPLSDTCDSDTATSEPTRSDFDSLLIRSSDSDFPASELASAGDEGRSSTEAGGIRSGQRFIKGLLRDEHVTFAASYPRTIQPPQPFLTKVWVFPEDKVLEAGARARAESPEPTIFQSQGAATVKRRARLIIRLTIEKCSIDPEYNCVVWGGEIVSVGFLATPISNLTQGSILGGKAQVTAGGVPICTTMFNVKVGAPAGIAVKHGDTARTGFISYAGYDRFLVLGRVQGLEAAGIKVFMDVRSLLRRDLYNERLFEWIEQADRFYLFWSRHARRSKYVEREWRHALGSKGLDFIDPIPLTDPRRAPPPPELGGELHFNDWMISHEQYERSLGIRGRLLNLILRP